MAGIHFGFDNFKQLLDLSIGVAQRLDESRAESFTLLYCDFSIVNKDVIDASLEQVLRTSDSIVNSDGDYFFVLPYTDKYGAAIVKGMFDEFFAKNLDSYMVSYPIDGEHSKALVEELADIVSATYKNDLACLDIIVDYK
jgi:ubiquinone/menaquinone biosynthesis C-methylase UbiE